MTDSRKHITRASSFSQEIHQEAFAIWYKLERPPLKQIVKLLKEQSKDGRAPTTTTLQWWHKEDSWDDHADMLDAEAEQAGDMEIIKQRQGIIQKMATVGADLVDMGMDYLKKNGIENSADAIRAIGKGAELQDKLLGWAAYFAELSTATNEELEKKLKHFMGEEPIEATAINASEQDDSNRSE